jgi:D-glycero-alpha-D-manno-heptose-7-phosphate kinase
MDLIKAVVKNMNTSGQGLNIFLRNDIPPKSGLGSSASCFVALIGLFDHMNQERKMTRHEIADMAYKLERAELGITGGYQDQYAAAFGGLNYIEFEGHHVRVNPIRIKKDHLMELEKHLVLAHISERGTSGDIIKDQQKSYSEKKASVVDAMDMVKQAAEEMRTALIKGDLNRFGELLHEGWEAKKGFSPLITTPKIDQLYELARKHGAIGGKITGAGGGGHFLFFCSPNKEQIVREKLEQAGAKPLEFTLDNKGLQTWGVNSNG